MKRCYFDDIPDEAITNLEKINRVPSYKSIAVAILSNDLMLRSLGFYEEEGELAKKLRFEFLASLSKLKQSDLFR